MEKQLRFQITKGEPAGIYPKIPDPDFGKAKAIANKFNLTRRKVAEEQIAIPILTSPTNPGLKELFRLLNSSGWKPNFSRADKGDLTFRVRVNRIYTEDEINQASMLYLDSTIGEWPLCSFVAKNEDRWIGSVEDVGSETGEGWEQPYGSVDGSYNYFVSTKLKLKLERSGLKGLQFFPLGWDKPSEAEMEYWELSSTKLMPPCELPMSDVGGFKFYDEGCYSPVELLYPSTDRQKICKHDFLLTSETIEQKNRPNCGNRLLIVSQQTRKVLDKLGISAAYNLVRFSDDLEKETLLTSLFESDIDLA